MDKKIIDEEVLQPMELFHARSLSYIKRYIYIRKMTTGSDRGSGPTKTAETISFPSDFT